MKWFCAVCATTLDFYDDYDLRDVIRVALRSALRNTSLQPHVIYDGPENGFTAELRRMGATVIFRRTSLYDALADHIRDNWMWLQVACGAFLRFEVPLVETKDEIALYTDCDVLFLREPDFGPQPPVLFAATSQFSTNPAEDMNSGVMLMNLPNMRRLMPQLMDFSRQMLHLGLDQEVLRAFFQDHYLTLDRTLNWKPYWGWNPGAQIVHFHGPKPAAVRKYLVDGTLPANQGWADLLTGERTGAYQAYARLWYLYRDSMGGVSG